MSPRKTILRELSRTAASHPDDGFTRPSEIPGFDFEPEKYQKAVNRLLQDRLIEGKKDAEGRMAIALNPHRIPDVRRELRAPWANPMVWAAVTVAAVLVAFVLFGAGGGTA